MSTGWIKLNRSIQENWLWEEKPFDKKSAWIDLLLMANHKNNKFPLGNEIIEVEQGSFITSEIKLMNRWGWSKTKLRNFLKLLESEKMITKVVDRKKTTISIVNYKVYQGSEDQEKTTEKPQEDQEKTIKKPQEDTNKNDNNEKNEKNNILVAEIISYLNEKTDKNFKSGVAKNRDLIKARLKEGYSLEDFKKVIDIKVAEWLNDEAMSKFLRPETLFSNKFEGYLNQKPKQEVKKRIKKDPYASIKER
nr:MAG TPA: hypothetical protein [Caudoviricetes sp.]